MGRMSFREGNAVFAVRRFSSQEGDFSGIERPFFAGVQQHHQPPLFVQLDGGAGVGYISLGQGKVHTEHLAVLTPLMEGGGQPVIQEGPVFPVQVSDQGGDQEKPVKQLAVLHGHGSGNMLKGNRKPGVIDVDADADNDSRMAVVLMVFCEDAGDFFLVEQDIVRPF